MLLSSLIGLNAQTLRTVQQRIADGVLEGVVSADGKVRTFKGIPFAQPPIGALRWKAPQPVIPWTGVRKAVEYGPRPMQGRIFDDMIFHDAGPSEDCLYLNVWLPEDQPKQKLPVMVWIYGGGLSAGSTSEPRQDGGNLSRKGVVVVSMNYRLGIFGFMAHPELTKESGHDASGNYGYMDQIAALEWVHRNIAAFGGDPDNVTIFGESAGSSSVCALMASPNAKGLFHRAIGESSSLFRVTSLLKTRAEAEQLATGFIEKEFGTASLEALRARPAAEILESTLKQPRPSFGAIVDGYILPNDTRSTYGSGQQAHVPLLAGWNTDEGGPAALLQKDAPTLANFQARARARYGDRAQAFLQAYAASNDKEAKLAARDFGTDNTTGYAMWKWLELHRQTGKSPVYRYFFEQTLPLAPGTEPVSPHASEIEYVFRVLPSRELPWQQEHRDVSELMASYWTNFAKAGNPNGPGLPNWPEYKADTYSVMHLQENAAAAPDTRRARYEFLDQQKRSP
ncbi:MAG: carboxylesterase family protein [Opitutus sp.]